MKIEFKNFWQYNRFELLTIEWHFDKEVYKPHIRICVLSFGFYLMFNEKANNEKRNNH